MKAWRVLRPHSWELVETPVPNLAASGSDRILVRTAWVSLCGSDIPFLSGNKRHKTYPFAPGVPAHECAGQVVESSSALFHPGEQVLAIPDGDQGLAEYFIAQASKAIHLPPELAEHDDCCLIQPLSTVLNAVDQLGDIRGKSVVVVGLGSIGLFFCWLLNKHGAGLILGIDPNAYRCHVAEGLGASKTIPTRSIEVAHAARQEPGAWHPPDICIEAVGHQMETLNDCLELVRRQGTVLCFGVPDQPVYAIEFETFFRKNIHLVAAVTPEWREYLTRACELFRDCHEELAGLVTHRLPIKEVASAFSLYERHEDGILKVILDASVWE